MPEEPAEAEDGNCGSGDDNGRAETDHCVILVLYKAPRKQDIAKLDYQLT
jgi:hypothetical protein